jgi:hypothetical protein
MQHHSKLDLVIHHIDAARSVLQSLAVHTPPAWDVHSNSTITPARARLTPPSYGQPHSVQLPILGEVEELLALFSEPCARRALFTLPDLAANEPVQRTVMDTWRAARVVAEHFHQQHAVPNGVCGLCNTNYTTTSWCDGPWGLNTVCAKCDELLSNDDPLDFLVSFKTENGGDENIWDNIFVQVQREMLPYI